MVAAVAIVFGLILAVKLLQIADTLAEPLFLDEAGEQVAGLAGLFDVLDVEFRHGGIAAAAMERADAENALTEALLQRDVLDAVEADLILRQIQYTGFDKELFLVQRVDGEGPGQTQEFPSSGCSSQEGWAGGGPSWDP